MKRLFSILCLVLFTTSVRAQWTPATASAAAEPWKAISAGEQLAIDIFFLATLTGSWTPSTAMAAAAPWRNISPGDQTAVQTYFLSLLATNIGYYSTNVYYASGLGAHMNAYVTNYLDGDSINQQGARGSDDTSILQNALNTATNNGKGVVLVIDGPCLVSGLVVWSNTTIQCIGNGGLYNSFNSGWPVVRNANPTTNAIIDCNISLIGGNYFLGGDEQAGSENPDVDFELAAGNGDGFYQGIGFYGISNAVIKGLTIIGGTLSINQYATAISNWRDIQISDCYVNQGTSGGKDGFHFFTGTNLFISHCRGISGSDFVALNSSDYLTGIGATPWVIRNGNILNVVIDGIVLLGGNNGVGIAASSKVADNIVVKNISGTVNFYAVSLWNPWDTTLVGGYIGSVTLDNINVNVTPSASAFSTVIVFCNSTGSNYVQSLKVSNSTWSTNTAGAPWLSNYSANSKIQSLQVQNFSVIENPVSTTTRSVITNAGTIGFLQVQGLTWQRPGSVANIADYVLGNSNLGFITNVVMANISLDPSIPAAITNRGVILPRSGAGVSIAFPSNGANWTNTTGMNMELYISNVGVTSTVLKKNGTTIVPSGGLGVLGDAVLNLGPSDYFSESYSGGSPTAVAFIR